MPETKSFRDADVKCSLIIMRLCPRVEPAGRANADFLAKGEHNFTSSIFHQILNTCIRPPLHRLATRSVRPIQAHLAWYVSFLRQRIMPNALSWTFLSRLMSPEWCGLHTGAVNSRCGREQFPKLHVPTYKRSAKHTQDSVSVWCCHTTLAVPFHIICDVTL